MVRYTQFSELLRALRAERSLSQLQLSELARVSPSTIQSYEQGRRLPDATNVELLRNALAIDNGQYAEVRRLAGLSAVPTTFVSALKKARGPVETIWDEVQGYPWICLIMNERREITAWNRLANRVGEVDLASLSQFERNLLRMAATDHYDRHLVNWEELIGRLIGVFKHEGSDLSSGEAAQYLQSVIQSIVAEEDERFYMRIFSLFASAELWKEGSRNVHPIRWKLDDGTQLAFTGVFGEFSLYDGLLAFDWHAADPTTAEWVAIQAADNQGESPPPEYVSFGATLARERDMAKLSRPKLAKLAGISAASIAAYESDARSPSREAILALCRALTIDGYETNRFLREADFDEEPSDFARFLAGDEPISVYRGIEPPILLGPRPIFKACDDLEWPCAVIDSACHVVHANRSARRIFQLSRFRPLPGRPGPHLLQLMVSNEFLEQVGNWEEVASVILPGRLEPLVLGANHQASSRGLREVATQVKATSARGLDQLSEIWSASPGYNSLRRPGVPLAWTASDGTELAFNCVISGWNSFDPYKALDLFPADAATFEWLANG